MHTHQPLSQSVHISGREWGGVPSSRLGGGRRSLFRGGRRFIISREPCAPVSWWGMFYIRVRGPVFPIFTGRVEMTMHSSTATIMHEIVIFWWESQEFINLIVVLRVPNSSQISTKPTDPPPTDWRTGLFPGTDWRSRQHKISPKKMNVKINTSLYNNLSVWLHN